MERWLVLATSAYRRAPVTLSLLASTLVSKVVTDLWQNYMIFCSLGVGGLLPVNVVGWFFHCFVLSPLSLGQKWTRGDLSRNYLPLKDGGYVDAALIEPRKGSRPVTAGVAPHRQLTQSLCRDLPIDQIEAISMELIYAMDKLAADSPSHLTSGQSKVEPLSHALFALSHTLVSSGPSRSTRSAAFPSPLSRQLLSSMKGAEFFHIHTSATRDKGQDGSVHCILHPQDAALVIERGWGELHALAGFPDYSGFWIGWPSWLYAGRSQARWWSKSEEGRARRGIPPTYCMVYAPRDGQELEVVKAIMRAAVAFATGMTS